MISVDKDCRRLVDRITGMDDDPSRVGLIFCRGEDEVNAVVGLGRRVTLRLCNGDVVYCVPKVTASRSKDAPWIGVVNDAKGSNGPSAFPVVGIETDDPGSSYYLNDYDVLVLRRGGRGVE